jgi:probable F420-dependent oxidoreductase
MTIGGPYGILPQYATAVEDAGFDAVWVAETGQSAIVQAAVVAQATERVQVGTNIVLAFPTAPAMMGLQAWDLGELSGGRFTIGLGSQVKRIIQDRFGVDFRPAAQRMREYVEAMHTTWDMHTGRSGEPYEGELYQVRHPGVTGTDYAKGTDLPDPPVYVAGVGPLMVAGAAAVADGLLGHPFTSDRYIETVVHDRIGVGLEEAGRDRGEFSLSQGLIVAVSEDAQEAREWAKQQIAFYGTTPNYRAVFESYGDEHLMGPLRDQFSRDKRDIEALRALVPEEAVDRYAVAGTADEVRDRVADLDGRGLADHWVIGGPWYRMSMEDLGRNAMATLDALRR